MGDRRRTMGAHRAATPDCPAPSRHPGRKRLDPRTVLCGILVALCTGIRREFLPQEPGFGSRMTCGRRLRDRNEAGVRKKLHELLLSELRAALPDFSRAAVDSSHIRAMKGGPATGPSPADRGKTGSKHHVIIDAHPIPLATITAGGNRNDVTQLIPLIEAVPPIRGNRGQPPRRPKHLHADRGYDHETYPDQVRRFEITPHIARRGIEHGSGLGRLPPGRGRHTRAAALVPPPAYPLGDPRPHPQRVRHPRLRHHLLATTSQPLNLLGVLSASCFRVSPGRRWARGRTRDH